MVFQNDILAGSSGGSSASSVYKIDQSIRFNASDYPKMTRTPSSAGNRRTFTLSTWIKRGALSTDQVVFGSYINTTNYFLIYFDGTSHSTDNTFRVYEYNGNVLKFWVYGTQKFRDPSAWYHFVVSVDTTNAVSNERIRLYVNGSRITDLTQNQQPALNYETYINSTNLQTIGEFYGNYYHFDGYMAEMHLLDGYAYDPSYFGLFNENGIWIPKEYSGSYGTNGFHIKGESASDLGNDSSGNNNDFTTSGLASHDQMVGESPTNNFAVLNTLDKGSNTTLANGNIEFTSSNDGGVRSSVFFNADKYYIEAIVGTYGNAFSFGISNADRSLSADAGTDLADFYGWYINPAQNWIASGSNPWNTGSNSASASKDVMQIAIDASDPSSIKLFAGINNTYYNSSGGSDGNPSTGANPTATITGSEEWSIGFWNRDASASNIFVNFGQEGTFGGNKTAGGNSDAKGIGNFFYSVPTGFKALCTKNLGS